MKLYILSNQFLVIVHVNVFSKCFKFHFDIKKFSKPIIYLYTETIFLCKILMLL